MVLGFDSEKVTFGTSDATKHEIERAVSHKAIKQKNKHLEMV